MINITSNDPFSSKIRRFASWETVRSRYKEFAACSLMDSEDFSGEQLRERYRFLSKVEEDLGFAYFAERQWLAYLQIVGGRTLPYSEWVYHQLRTVIFSEAKPDFTTGGQPILLFESKPKLFWFPPEEIHPQVGLGMDFEVAIHKTLFNLQLNTGVQVFNCTLSKNQLLL